MKAGVVYLKVRNHVVLKIILIINHKYHNNTDKVISVDTSHDYQFKRNTCQELKEN